MLCIVVSFFFFFFFFFNDTATTEIYTLSLHDALPSWPATSSWMVSPCSPPRVIRRPDRKSTRLNSSHVRISYAVFCLKKKQPTSSVELSSKKHTTKLKSRPQRICS